MFTSQPEDCKFGFVSNAKMEFVKMLISQVFKENQISLSKIKCFSGLWFSSGWFSFSRQML